MWSGNTVAFSKGGVTVEKYVTLIQNKKVVMTAHQADVREKIEHMIMEKIGFFPDMQEHVEENEDDVEEYFVCVHSDAYGDLDDGDIQKLEELNITMDEEATTEAVKMLFDLQFQVVEMIA